MGVDMSYMCEMCGSSVDRVFEIYLTLDGKEEGVACCGRCKMLSDINDSLKKIASHDKATFSPI